MSLPYNKSYVTAIIPAKDEGKGLAKIISEVSLYAGEVIVVDGHSKDNTKKIVEKTNAKYLLDQGKGRGNALKLGIEKSTNETIVFVDADGSHEISDIPKLVIPVLKKQADLVISSRRTGGSSDMEMNFDGLIRSAGSDLLVMLTNSKFGTHLTDILYSFRAVNKTKFKKAKLSSDGFAIEQEMVIEFLRKRYQVIEIPSREKARAWGKSKLKTLGGISLFFSLIDQLYFRD